MNWSVVLPEPFELGESPFWHPREQALYWVDIVGRKILRANVFIGTAEAWEIPVELGEPGCMAPAASGGFVIALRSGIYRAREWRGPLRQLAGAPYDAAHIRFNDGKADPLGRFWAGSYCEDKSPRAELFCLDARPHTQGAAVATHAGLRRMAGDAAKGYATGANGLAWSPDARVLYWADTAAHVVRAWDWNAVANTLSGERVFHQFADKPTADGPSGHAPYQGRPDGAAVDVEGNYYLAMYEGGCVKKLSPQGTLLASFPVPALCPTMPCFGGDDMQTLYLTSARHGRPTEELAGLPLSGCVLSMRVDVPGLPVNLYQD
jgi:sugar lactone lactonase YvrE